MPTSPNLKLPDPGPRVTFTAPDGQADRIADVLTALGYQAQRVTPDDESQATLRACQQVRDDYRLTRPETALLCGIVDEADDSRLAEVQGGQRQLKWVARSLFAKLGLDNGDRAGLKSRVDEHKSLRGSPMSREREIEAHARRTHTQIFRAAQALGCADFPATFETHSWLTTFAGRVADRAEEMSGQLKGSKYPQGLGCLGFVREPSLTQARGLAEHWRSNTLTAYERAVFFVWANKRLDKLAPHGANDETMSRHLAGVFKWDVAEGARLFAEVRGQHA